MAATGRTARLSCHCVVAQRQWCSTRMATSTWSNGAQPPLDLTWLWTVRLVHTGAERPSEAKNCTPPRAAIIRLARKDSVSFRVAKVMHVQRVAVQSPRSATVIRRIVLEHGLHSRRDFVMGDDLNLHVPTPVIAN